MDRTADAPALRRLWRRGAAFLGTEFAVMGGAMTWVSERNLVAAISEVGGFGVIACGAMDDARLGEEIAATQSNTGQPFGVNLILMHPDLDRLAEVCLDHRVGHVVLAGGLPNRAIVEKLKTGGTKVMAFAPSLGIAKKLVRTGVDALIIEGMEAGGHIGPVATSVLAQEILPEMQEVPVFVAGGIGHGEAVAAYLRMGAAGIQVGTMFVCAEESIAHPSFKQAFVKANAREAQPSVQVDPTFKVIPVRAIANAATRRFIETQIDVIRRYRDGMLTHEEASLEIEHFWAGALRRAVIDGDIETGSLMAGQSVGMVKSVRPTSVIINELVAQAEHALTRGRDDMAPLDLS